ncbi:polysaccharide biosynthesis protein [Pseudalkalibacillus berkeleyi]|uniref:Polysaccharide biosynthesis protein n=1 Tax=Pseudalkalibacillus berkeleyi TaxID=1069813 RepID=A0ABS9H1F6_9BACL|nr:nucleoside-diphosphate sugar epimerase/dehydratase [Pseudalkalibacillus berkeleyi]MCF6138829.1 polysaccharide biosynthesis protein [Pseudalkalibacillus berkeleyi]
MTYKKRISFLIFIDSIIVLTAIYASSYLLNYHQILLSTSILASSFILLIGHHIFSYYYKLYKRVWQYASIGELIIIFKTVTFSVLGAGLAQMIFIQDIYFRALVITWMLHMLLMGGSRFIWRVYRDTYMNPNNKQNRTLIIGAGSAGTMVLRQLKQNNLTELYPVAFVDDDVRKQQLEILGVPVAGTTVNIKDIVEQLEVDHIIIAIPSLKKSELNRIYQECLKTNIKTQILPKIEDLMLGNVSINQFRDVKVEDLLGRDPVELDIQSISKELTGQTILVTGAGGSIGSEICRQVCKFTPKKVLLLGHGENSIYQIDMELRQKYGEQIKIIPIIADIQDRDRIFEVMNVHQPDVIYHAAAHKHVPLMEYNPKEAVKNNVLGTKNVAEAADEFRVKTFVLVSSDKAVNPTNVMGSTKRIAEMIIQELDKKSQTNFVAVRFGNVLGSRGSVIPLFKKQIQAGGPVTVTHPDMTRYFMTIPEASRLVIQAGALARGGEIFVLDMGESVKIVDLAKNLIQLSGYSVNEIGLNYSGIRPGEKMYEELLGEGEVHPKAVFPKIFIGKSVDVDYDKVSYLVENHFNLNQEEIAEYVLDLANEKEFLAVSNAN